jgi:hypothetical protein
MNGEMRIPAGLLLLALAFPVAAQTLPRLAVVEFSVNDQQNRKAVSHGCAALCD